MLSRAVVVMQRRKLPSDDTGYDVVSLRNIERIEQIFGIERAAEI